MDYRENEEKIIEQNSGLVRAVALKFFRAGQEELEDLIQIGYIGLIKAARNFDSERGVKFSTYAVPMITGEIKSQLRDRGRIKVSRELKKDAGNIKRAEADFIARNGRSPRISELCSITLLSAERINEALCADEALNNIEEYENADIRVDNEDKQVTHIDLNNSIENLPEMERKIIILRYYRDCTQQQAARLLGISQVQVCRIEKKTLKKLSKEV